MFVEMDHGASHIDKTGIPAPWKELEKYINQSTALEDRLQNFYDTKNRVDDFDDTAVDKVVSKAKNLKTRSSKLSTKLEKRAKEVQRMLGEAEDILGNAKVLRNDIADTINALNRYGTNDHHVKLPQATQEASRYLDDIKFKLQNFNQTDAALQCAKESFKFWTDAAFESESINIGRSNTKMSLQELQDRFRDLEKHTHRTLSTVDSADETQTKNEIRYDNLREKFDEIQGLEADVEDKLNNSLTAQSESTLEMIRDNLENIEMEVVDLQAVNKEMNETLVEVGGKLVGLKGVDLPEAKKHVENLLKESNSFTELFRNTKEGAEIAMMASTAHQNISAAIEAAKLAAQKALAAVQQTNAAINPKDEQSIMERGIESITESQNIEQEALTEIVKLDGKLLARGVRN
jgi:laminin, alpha 1/2